MAIDDSSRTPHIERLVESIELPVGRWDCEARLVFCNPSYLAWAAQPRDALLGRSLLEIYGEGAWQAARGAYEQAFAGRTVSYERLLRHGAAPGRWARIQLFPDTDAQGRVDSVYSIAFDIHDDVVAREALAAARRRFDRFAENIPFPLSYVDRDFVLRFVNKAYTEAIGQRAEALLGRRIDEVRGARRWAEDEPYFRDALQGRAAQYTRLVSAQPHGQRWMRTSYVPDFDAGGAVVGLYTVTVDVHELTITQENLKRSVERDALTDVLSRRTMMERIAAELADTSRAPVALFFIDLDGFKAVNDRLGHHQGDTLLVSVGAALQAAVRAEDTVGRFGGDEFLVLAPLRDALGAQALALHLLAAVRSATADGALAGMVSASIGYAIAPIDASHPLKLLELADDAMYHAKRLGKNQALHCARIPVVTTTR